VVTQGATFTLNGSFSDAPGDGPWYVDVNYGDGTATQYAISLTPNSQGVYDDFVLSHVYAKAGLWSAQVTLINGDDQIVHAATQVTVSGFTVDDGTPQQSLVRSLTYVFPSPTQAGPSAFELLRNGRLSKLELLLEPLSDGMTYIITFRGPGVIGGSLPDGSYTLITLHNKVNVVSGAPMTENDVNTFVRLFGDVNGDGVVNAADKLLLEQAEADPSSPDAADFEYDGTGAIDRTDIAQFAKRYGKRLDLPSKPPARFLGREVRRQAASRSPDGRERDDRTGAVHV
jgi:Dockerin type I domain